MLKDVCSQLKVVTVRLKNDKFQDKALFLIWNNKINSKVFNMPKICRLFK